VKARHDDVGSAVEAELLDRRLRELELLNFCTLPYGVSRSASAGLGGREQASTQATTWLSSVVCRSVVGQAEQAEQAERRHVLSQTRTTSLSQRTLRFEPWRCRGVATSI
jgi:hypothetical protein